MKEFLRDLEDGIKIKELNPKQKELIRNLSSLNAVFEDKGHCYLNSAFAIGKLDISMAGTGFLMIFSNKQTKDAIIEASDLNAAHFGDIVLAKFIKTKKKRLHAKVMMIIKPANATSVVYLKQIGKQIVGINVKTSLASELKATQKSLKQLPPYTLLKIDNKTNEIKEVIGNLSSPMVDEKISLAIYNKNSEFNQECIMQAASFGDDVDLSMYPNRIDLRDLAFCTIDPIDAKDFDDAIYYDLKERTLYVAIADVSEYVHPYTPMDQEAKFRGFSIYFPHKSIPMLPRNLSENICSLKPNLTRLAFVFKIKFDENLNVISEELFEGAIISKRRYNYDEVDEILASKTADEKEILSWILPLFEISKKLKAARLKVGFDFKSQELRMRLDQNEMIDSTRFEGQSLSHDLIEECMLLANKAAAKRLVKGIFRNHPPADSSKIASLLDELSIFGIKAVFEKDLSKMITKIQTQADNLNIRHEVDKLIIKAQKKAIYESQARGHFGLGFKHYAHFTSPIRRYSDLLLHRFLKANLSKDEGLFKYLSLNLDESCEELNLLEREADRVQYDFFDRKFARWAAENLGKRVRCFISENEKFFCAQLDDEFKGAKIILKSGYEELLRGVEVKITQADIAEAKIYGEIIKRLD